MNALGLLRRALRGVREHLYLFVVATGVIAAALVLLGMFVLVVVNVRGMVDGWQKDVHVSAYFKAEIPAEEQAVARSDVAGRAEVAGVALVTPAEAATWMSERMPEMAPVVAELGADAMPASLEVTLRPPHQGGDAIEAFADSLMATGRFVAVDYGREWVARASSFLDFLGILGLALGVVIGVAALFLVGNTINLVVLARRDELEILRLVGASDAYILGPFLVEGLVQGLLAALLAWGVLIGVHHGLLAQLDEVVPLAFGGADLSFLPASLLSVLTLVGMGIGAVPAWVAVRRFLAGLP